MPQAEKQNTVLSSIDTIHERLDQSRGVLAAVQGTYDHETEAFTLGDAALYHAIDAAYALIMQARDASCGLNLRDAATEYRSVTVQ